MDGRAEILDGPVGLSIVFIDSAENKLSRIEKLILRRPMHAGTGGKARQAA
jgi:hypothetical protein